MSTNIFELILLQRENPNSSPFLNSLLMFQNQWILMKTVFEKLFQDHECDRAHATDIWLQINQNSPSLVSVTINYYLDELNQKLAHKYQQEFFSYFGDIESGNENVNLQQFLQAFHYLNQIFQIHKAFSSILELKDHPQLAKNNNIDSHQIMENVIGKFKIAILNTKKFRTIVFMFLNLEYRLFKNHVVGTMSNEGEIEDLELIQYENSQLEQNFQFDGQLLVSFSEVLYELEFFDKLHEIIYIFTTDKLINYTENAEKVMDSPTGGPYLHRLLDYFQRFIKSFILQLYFKIAQADENHRTALTDLVSRLVYFIYELYAKKMINKMCDIILDAEEINLKTIHEIREATEKAHMMNNLAKSLIQQIKARLLIPGVITQTIIRYFIDTVKILQLIDPTGSIYDTVTNPLKNYLLQRPDALRGIIDILTEDTEAYTKLGQNTITIPTDQYVENSNDMSSDEDEKAAENWQVLPLQNRVHAKSSVKYKVSDMVTWLVNLYGSQEAFINEYQNMLGEKLITITEPTKIDEEIKKFELLKAKFGDNYLQNCQVIVRDIRDSKRINKNIHRTHDKQFVKMELENANDAASDSLEFKKLNAIFLSKSYWPINYDYEAFKIPAHLQQTFDQYTEKYSETKAMRRLIWHHSLGGVELNLSFDNGSFTFKCLPTHAILIGYFDERNNGSQGVSLDFLSSELNIPTTTVRQLMSFWVHKGVVQEKKSLNAGGNSVKKNPAFAGYFTTGEQGDVGSIFYVPVKEYDGTQTESLDINEDVENELMKGGQLSGDATQFNTLIEGLIVIMLKTNGPKSVEKIHQLLKTVYRTDIPHSYTENQTKEILRKMLAKQTIAFNGEVYSTRV